MFVFRARVGKEKPPASSPHKPVVSENLEAERGWLIARCRVPGADPVQGSAHSGA